MAADEDSLQEIMRSRQFGLHGGDGRRSEIEMTDTGVQWPGGHRERCESATHEQGDQGRQLRALFTIRNGGVRLLGADHQKWLGWLGRFG